MTAGNRVLVSWIALNNDPYERKRGEATYKLVNNEPVPGPTLTILFDDASPFIGLIGDVVILHRKTDGPEGVHEKRAVEETVVALREQKDDLRIHLEPWSGSDPTDHRDIFEFLKEILPRLRRRFAERELILHISPGTPSMQTIWVLMAETGFVESPFQLVKSYRKIERRGRPAVVPVKLGIETFYKVYKTTRPRQVASEDQDLVWDPGRFQTTVMRKLFAEARRFAHLNVPVMILGERGTGKTTLAGWMRMHSPFRRSSQDAHWPAVACGQYSPETMRSELFGYKKGSFTGATKDTDGLLAAADGDTLFLDEVGDVSCDLQRLLIKALEEKKYFPLGDDRPRKSDFRLLTATNVGWSELQRRLDPDFLDRITLLTLVLPPLREIRDEIPWLWETAFEQAVQRTGIGKRQSQLGVAHHRRIASNLMLHPLSGNLRDLFRVAYRVLAAKADPDNPLNPEEAVEYGLQGLEDGGGQKIVPESLSRSVVRAFADLRPLDALFGKIERIPFKTVERDLKAYIAKELRRLAKIRSIPVEQLCDVTDRTLRSWIDDARKESSESRNISSKNHKVK
jgi:transcriptional regulator with AAA-type ATPase domain